MSFTPFSMTASDLIAHLCIEFILGVVLALAGAAVWRVLKRLFPRNLP